MNIEGLKKSNAWDSRYDLPLFPQHNNPWIYMAYADALLEEKLDREKVFAHYLKCRKSVGLMNRWPDGSGGITSHDELIGVSYFSAEAAEEILNYLNKTDGVYLNEARDEIEERFNIYRFPWAIAYMRVRAGYRLGIYHLLGYFFHVLFDLILYKEGTDFGGRMMLWLMNQEMKKQHWLLGLVIRWWEGKMVTKGATPKVSFLLGLPAYPIMTINAPEHY